MSILPECIQKPVTKTSDFFKISLVHRLWTLWLIYWNMYTSEITPKWAKKQIFIFMSKANLGTLPSTVNTFLVLLDSVCAVTALITNCYKSQIETAGIPDLLQFVTHNLGRFKTQQLRLMSIMPDGVDPSTKTRSHRHRAISRRFPWYIVYGYCIWFT